MEVVPLLLVESAVLLEDINCVTDKNACIVDLCDGGVERTTEVCSPVLLEGDGAEDDCVTVDDTREEDVITMLTPIEDSAAPVPCVEDDTASLTLLVENGTSRDKVLV